MDQDLADIISAVEQMAEEIDRAWSQAIPLSNVAVAAAAQYEALTSEVARIRLRAITIAVE